MMQTERLLRETLAKIVQVASEALNIDANFAEEPHEGQEPEEISKRISQENLLVCTPKALPSRLLVKAAETAMRINPTNVPVIGPLTRGAEGVQVSEPLRIAVLTSKYWGPTPRMLTVGFMETTSADLRTRIISHMRAWNRTASISFVETNGTGDVRISRGPGGYWAYLGTDILHIPKNRPTMNLEGFTMNTPETEYKRVVCHETGHTPASRMNTCGGPWSPGSTRRRRTSGSWRHMGGIRQRLTSRSSPR
jgi:hypothetical protein